MITYLNDNKIKICTISNNSFEMDNIKRIVVQNPNIEMISF